MQIKKEYLDKTYDIEGIQNHNLAPKSKVIVSSNYGESNPPEYIHDGSHNGVVESDISSVVEVHLVSHNVQVEAGEVEHVDKTALEAAIQSAEQLHSNAEEGSNPGQYPEGSKAKLMEAIEIAKVALNNATTQVEVDQALINLNQSVQEFIDSKIEDTSLVGDVNKDGKIDVADLGLVAYYHMAKEGDDNWNKAQVADVVKDGIVDIEDLSFVANTILEK